MNNLTWGILIALAFWMTPAPAYTRGYSTWYAPQVMEATCEYRGLSLDGYVDGVAMMSPANIGEEVWINGPLGWEGPFLVCDCGVRGQVYEMVVSRKEVIEVGWRTAARWGLGPHDGGWKTWVEVSKSDPVDIKHVVSVDYVAWFLKHVETVPCRVWLPNGSWEACR